MVKFEDMQNPLKSSGTVKKMINEHLVMRNMFEFFSNKSTTVADRINYSTFQTKYGEAYWLTVNQIETPHLGTIKAVKRNNSIDVLTTNINSFSIKLKEAYGKKLPEKLRVTVNSKVYFDQAPLSDTVTITLKKQSSKFIKHDHLEGPINHFFSDSFKIVRGTAGPPSAHTGFNTAIDSIISNWNYNYFGNCAVINDTKISETDIAQSNLLLVGNANSNALIKKISNYLPVSWVDEGLIIKSKKYIGKNNAFSLIFPNPLNPKKYVLIISSDNGKIPVEQIQELSYKGWMDYEVWDTEQGSKIDDGEFDSRWN